MQEQKSKNMVFWKNIYAIFLSPFVTKTYNFGRNNFVI